MSLCLERISHKFTGFVVVVVLFACFFCHLFFLPFFLQILADQQSPHQKTHHRPPDVHPGHTFLQPDLPLRLLALPARSEPEPRQVPLLRQPQVRLHLAGQPPHHALGIQGPQEPARAGGFETDGRPVRRGHVTGRAGGLSGSHFLPATPRADGSRGGTKYRTSRLVVFFVKV